LFSLCYTVFNVRDVPNPFKRRENKMKKKWDIESLKVEALKYSSRKDFKKYSMGAYSTTIKKGVIDDICSHMDEIRTKWTKELIKKESLKYNNRTDFREKIPGAYQACKRLGILDEVCLHMREVRHQWNEESITQEALKYKTRKEFEIGKGAAYRIARELGIIDKICSHMIYRIKTDVELNNIALKYTSKKSFYKNESGAYYTASVRGILDNICSHMDEQKSGYNKKKSGILYYIRFDHEENCSLWKIGITNSDIKSRLSTMRAMPGWTATIIQTVTFEDGAEARQLEKLYHKEFERFSYKGDIVLKNGNTELFTCDVMSL